MNPTDAFIGGVPDAGNDRETDVEKLGACSVCVDVG